MSNSINESVVEQCSLDWLGDLGYEVVSGFDDWAPRTVGGTRGLQAVFLFDHLQTGLTDLNPRNPLEGLQEALRKVRLVTP